MLLYILVVFFGILHTRIASNTSARRQLLKRYFRKSHLTVIRMVCAALALAAAMCSKPVVYDIPVAGGTVSALTTEAAFDATLKNQKNRLLIVDLYADWCGPCRSLAPILSDLAMENSARAGFYKVDIDQLPAIAKRYNVSSIPYVIYILDGEVVTSFLGLHVREVYLEAIDRYAVVPPVQ